MVLHRGLDREISLSVTTEVLSVPRWEYGVGVWINLYQLTVIQNEFLQRDFVWGSWG